MSNQKNPQNSNDDKIIKIIRIGLFVCLFMPLIFGNGFIFPYIFPKQALFQIIVEVLLGLYVFLALRQPQYRPRKSWLFTAIIVFFGAMIAGSLFGLNPYHSFWSDYERMAGLINLLHYLGFLFIAINVFKAKQDWYSFFDYSVFASVAEAFFGFSQLFGVSEGGQRIDGTIGNPSFLAGYMLINILFAFWLMLEKKEKVWRYFYIFAIIANLIILYSTETRGAVLALVVGVFSLALFLVFSSKEALSQLPIANTMRLKKIAIASFLAFFLVVGLVWAFRDSNFVKSQHTLSRITHISMKEDTSQTRLMAWQMSLKGFMERPIFGWGMENYYILFNKYYNPNLYPTESWFDRSHNAFLDVLTQAGLFGFLAYLAVFILAFYYLWRAYRHKKINYHTSVIFTVILIAYIVQNIFVFDTQVTLLMIYSILAFIIFLSFQVEEKNEIKSQPITPNFFLLLLIGAAVLFSAYSFNIKPGMASAKGVDALSALKEGDIKAATGYFQQAYKIGTFGLPEIAARAQDASMQVLIGREILKDDDKQLISLSIEGLKRAIAEYEPQNARLMMLLGNIYLSTLTTIPSHLEEADKVLSKALKLTPNRQELLFAVGQLKLYQGKEDEVLAIMKKAVDLNPKATLSHWNYGIMAIALNKKEIGEEEVKKAIELGHSYDSRDIAFLINAYGKINDLPKITLLYKEWIVMEPKNATPYARLAAAYAQFGDKQKAKEYALMAAQVDPDFAAEAEQFIKQLGL